MTQKHNDEPDQSTAQDLLTLSVRAAELGNSLESIRLLEQAIARPDVSAQAHFLLGSEYAQSGSIDSAIQQFGLAIVSDGAFHLARFQLGLLLLTQGRAQEARSVWRALAALGDDPLNAFRCGLEHLIKDEFPQAVQCLQRGVKANTIAPELNSAMNEFVRRIAALQADAGIGQPKPRKDSDVLGDEAISHLFVNAYVRGQLH